MGFGIKTRLLQYGYLVFRYRLPGLRWRLFRDTSQHGEYSVLRRMVTPSTPRIVVEVGANNGLRHSNSYPFIRRGWTGILVEPNPSVFRELQERYRNNERVHTINSACGRTPDRLTLHLGRDGDFGEFATLLPSASGAPGRLTFEVQVRTLTDVLAEVQCPSKFGILSVDTEGFDYQVLLGLDFQIFSPQFIITEDQSTDDAEKHSLLRRHGYARVRRRGCNSIWARTESRDQV